MPAIRLLALALVLSSLAACKKPATPADEASATPSGATPPAATSQGDEPAVAGNPAPDLGEFKIVSVVLGKSLGEDGSVTAESATFAPKDTIYVSVVSSGKHQGLSLSAKWSTADGTPIAVTQQALVPQAPIATTFRVANPAGWPAGKYQVVIAIDDHPMETRAFEVR